MLVSKPEKGDGTLCGLWEIKNYANWMSKRTILIQHFVKIGELVQTLK
jgi:hypothetical protein